MKKNVNVQFDMNIFELISKLAKEKSVAVSTFIRMIIIEYLRGNNHV